MRTSRVLIALAGGLASLFVQLGDANDDVREQLHAIRREYLANRQSFANGKCRFRNSIWSADSEADAVAGKPNDRKERISRTNTLMFRDDILTITPEYDPREVQRQLRNRDAIVPPLTYARKEDFAIDHDGLINTAIVYNPETIGRFLIRAHPFALAQNADSNPASHIDFAEARNYEGITFQIESAVRDGRKYILLKKRSKHDAHDKDEYIDPSRGHLSFITEVRVKRTGQLFYRMLLTAVHERNGRFFPVRAIIAKRRHPPDGLPYVEVREMEVLELDLDHRPTDEALFVPVHREAQYSDGVNANTAKTLYRNSKKELVPISVHDLEDIYDELQEIALERAEVEKRIQEQRSR